MPEPQIALTLVKEIGFPALLFIIWYVYHQAESRKWMTYLEQVESKNKQQFDLFKDIIATREKANDQQFQLLKDTLETINYHSQVLGRMEQKIDSNQQCPLIRKENKG